MKLQVLAHFESSLPLYGVRTVNDALRSLPKREGEGLAGTSRSSHSTSHNLLNPSILSYIGSASGISRRRSLDDILELVMGNAWLGSET